VGGWKPTHQTSTNIHINICINAVSVVPSGGETDVRRANTDVRWVGFHPLWLKKSQFWDTSKNHDELSKEAQFASNLVTLFTRPIWSLCLRVQFSLFGKEIVQ
jgi:hypothetical protein